MSLHLEYTNNAINFLIYATVGQKFRDDVKKLCCCIPTVFRFCRRSNEETIAKERVDPEQVGEESDGTNPEPI